MTNWIEQYLELLSENKIQDAFQLKKLHLPKTVFKYRTLDKNRHTLDCLLASSIWMSFADDLNDPYESSLNFDDNLFTIDFFNRENFSNEFYLHYKKEISEIEIQEIINWDSPEDKFHEICERKGIKRDFSNTKEKRQNLFSAYQKSKKKEIRISCFSERNDSILMWSHYSDGHKGICIEYDFNDSLEILPFFDPVFYTNKFSSIVTLGSRRKNNALRIASITKAQDWQYEKEWRLTFPLPISDSNLGHFNVPKPKTIFLGSRFNENCKEEILIFNEIVEKLSIPIIEMTCHKNEFRIIPK